MKKLLKPISVLLSLCFALTPVLMACNSTDTPSADTAATAATDTGTSDTEPKAPAYYIYENRDMKYTVVYSEKSEDAKTAAENCNKFFSNKVNNPAAAPSSDTNNAVELEILIGDTNRPESAQLKAELGDNSYRIKFIGKKLVIVAQKDWMLINAVSMLTQNFSSDKQNNKIVSMYLPQDFDLPKLLDGYVRENWTLSGFPVYEDGKLYEHTYKQSVGYQTLTSNQSNYAMQYVTDTSVDEFNNYITKLKSMSFDVDINTQTENIISLWVSKNTSRMYVYYSVNTGEVRFILDRESQTRKEFSDNYTKKSGDTAAVYLYSLAMDPDGENNSTLTEAHETPDNNKFYGSNCGELMVVKLYDNSVIIVDGGGYVQMSQHAAQTFDKFLHDITGTPSTQKVTIRTWSLSHPDGDHFTGFIRFMVNYHDNYDLQGVMYNLKNCPDELKTFLGEYLPAYYPDIVYHRPHTGEILTLGGVKFEILYTFEDLIQMSPITAQNKSGFEFGSTDNNNSSFVFRATIDGKTFFIGGDANGDAATQMLKMYTSGELNSDVMQVPHHGIVAITEDLTKWLNEISPSILLFPQSKGGATHWPTPYNAFKNLVGESNMYFADGDYNEDGTLISLANSGTVKVSVENGQLKPQVLTEYYDHTPYPTTESLQWGVFDDFNCNEINPPTK